MSGTIDTRIGSRHHDATVGAQTAFFENVKAMTTVLQDMDNPFQEESSDLLSLDTKNIAVPNLAQLVATHQQQFEVFLGGLHNEECSLNNTIKRTRLLSISKSRIRHLSYPRRRSRNMPEETFFPILNSMSQHTNELM